MSNIVHCVILGNNKILELETGIIKSIKEKAINSRLLKQKHKKPASFWLKEWLKLSGPNLQKINTLKILYGLTMV